MTQWVENIPTGARDSSSIPGWGIPLEKGVATHGSILAWKIPQTEEPGGLQSMGSQIVGCDLVTKQQKQLRIRQNVFCFLRRAKHEKSKPSSLLI